MQGQGYVQFCVLIGALLMCSACSTPTGYGPAGEADGYSDAALGANRYQVNFSGNYATPLDQAIDFAFLRVTEIAAREGESHFILTDASVGNTTLNIERPEAIGHITRQGISRRVEHIESESIVHQRPDVSLTVQFVDGGTTGSGVYRVDEIRELLSQKYVIQTRTRTIMVDTEE